MEAWKSMLTSLSLVGNLLFQPTVTPRPRLPQEQPAKMVVIVMRGKSPYVQGPKPKPTKR